MQYAPESERELAVILRRERLKRDYHAKPGNVQEYMEKLKKASRNDPARISIEPVTYRGMKSL